MFLFITADKIGSNTGGGSVTAHELSALSKLDDVKVINPEPQQNPFDTEKQVLKEIKNLDFTKVKLAHFYSATYPETVKLLKEKGVKVTYTVAAHNNIESKKEFELLNIPYNYPHMTDPDLFEKHNVSYTHADCVICPSIAAKKIMERIGCKNVEVIPHGCDEFRSAPLPKNFVVGYLGQVGPDKGVKYLLEAWSNLNYSDAVLNIAGSQSVHLLGLIRSFQKGNFNIMGYMKSVEDFFHSVSVYVQPSVTEGFGIEVPEALSCGRPCIVSDGAGASDCITDKCGDVFEKRNVEQLAKLIDKYKTNYDNCKKMQEACVEKGREYLWKNIEKFYVDFWSSLLK